MRLVVDYVGVMFLYSIFGLFCLFCGTDAATAETSAVIQTEAVIIFNVKRRRSRRARVNRSPNGTFEFEFQGPCGSVASEKGIH